MKTKKQCPKNVIKRTDGWAAQYEGVGTNIRMIVFQKPGTGTVRWREGGGSVDKKRFWQTPLSIFDVFGPSSYFKKYCIIL